jgi:hypothetical protein
MKNRTLQLSTHAFLAILIVAIMITLSTLGLLSISQTIPSSGTISSINVAVYSDSACTIPQSTISWGLISPGTTITKTIYIKNEGNIPMTLSMRTANWVPSNANNSITLTWNQEGTNLNPDQSTAATLTLRVDQSISQITSFSMSIIITGTG